jgi:internalin A
MSEQQEQKSSINFSNFADWCKHKDSLCEAARHTVDVLLKYAGTSDIDEANRILSSSNELNLRNAPISDITPLQSLTNLTSLCLGWNQISDITPLQSLTNLTSLDLFYNQISDITPLQSLTNLTSLDLFYNQISDITPLQSLTNLTSLYLQNNRISDITPLQSLTNLTELYLGWNQISDITALQSLTHYQFHKSGGNSKLSTRTITPLVASIDGKTALTLSLIITPSAVTPTFRLLPSTV